MSEEFELEEVKNRPGCVRVKPIGTVLIRSLAESLSDIRDIEIRPDDVWVVTYPKCGTTWTQEMVWLLMNNFDYERAKKEYLEDRFPYIEYSRLTNSGKDYVSLVKDFPSPRLLKSHLPYELLPRGIDQVKPKDLPGVIRKTAAFLGRPEPTETQMTELCNHLSFSSMRDNPSVNKTTGPEKPKGKGAFFRKGEIGNYKEELTDFQQCRLNEWVDKSLANSDFPYYRNK